MEKVPGHGVGTAEEMPGRPAHRPIIPGSIPASVPLHFSFENRSLVDVNEGNGPMVAILVKMAVLLR